MDLADLPTRRTEDWKYSDLRLALRDKPLPKGALSPAARGPIDQLANFQGAREITKVGAGENVLIVDRFDKDSLDARVREIDVQPGAALTRVIIQSGADVTLSAAYVAVAASGTYRQFVLAEGGKLARIETHVTLNGDGAEAELNGIYMCAGEHHADLTSVVTHRNAGGTTRQNVKGVVRAGGRGVFQGRIIVDHGAQKTDARQHHQALLLEEGAEAFAKPELIINADDVQCAHGNTIGALDEEALFYMRQRGLPEAEARALLIEAFLLQTVPDDLDEKLRGEIVARISNWLRARP